MENIFTFEQKKFIKNHKKNTFQSSILKLELNSAEFVNYLKNCLKIYLKDKTKIKEFKLSHVEVTIDGRVICFCFKSSLNETLRIVDDEP